MDVGDGSTKSDLMVSLGHEVLETQVLEGLGGGLFGIGSKPEKEALADAFGEQLAWRLGQVIDVGPDANGGEGFSDSLKQSDVVKYGTALADRVGSAKVEYRQLYVDEAKAILEAAPSYAERYGLSDDQAKTELLQQAQIMVDRASSELPYLTENARARDELQAISDAQPRKAKDWLTRIGFNQLFHTNESNYFEASEADYNDTYKNAAEAVAIEGGFAGEANLLTRYLTEFGKPPVDVSLGDAASEFASQKGQECTRLYKEVTTDPVGLVRDTAVGLYDAAATCLTSIQCVAPDQTHGVPYQRQFVAELLGQKDAAITEAAAWLGEDIAKITSPPGAAKAGRSGLDALLDAAGKRSSRDGWDTDDGEPRLPEVSDEDSSFQERLDGKAHAASGGFENEEPDPDSVVNKAGLYGDKFQNILSDIRAADFSAPKNGSVFWTGYQQGNQKAAMAWAESTGKLTIEMTSGGKWLESLDLYGSNSPISEIEADHLWRAASAQFSRSASGEINAFKAGTVFDRNKVFYGLELKNLSKNPGAKFPVIYRGE